MNNRQDAITEKWRQWRKSVIVTPKGICDRESKMVFMCVKGGLLEHVAFELCPEWWRKVVVSGQVSRRARKNMLQRALSTCLCTPCLYNGDPGACAIVDYFHIENLTEKKKKRKKKIWPIPSFLFLSPLFFLLYFFHLFTFSFFFSLSSVFSLFSPHPVCVSVYTFFLHSWKVKIKQLNQT